MNGHATTCHQGSRKGPSYAHYNICAIDLSVSGGGLCEVKQHMESKHHKDGTKAFTNQATMTSLLSQKKQSLKGAGYYSRIVFQNFHSRA